VTTGLRIEGLSVGYTRRDGDVNVVVSDLDLTLEPRSILGLAGESGCGKSTSALAAVGYRTPGGRILGGRSLLGEVDLLTLPLPELRSIWGRHVAYVAQNAATALNPAIPIGRQLAQPLVHHLGLRGASLRERQIELLEQVGLPDPVAAIKRHPHQFSGGQQQRIAIAIAISCRPNVLILDEPTTGLDVTTQARISGLLRSLVDETGVATLYVSHDLALLGTVADRMAVMYGGEIIEASTARQVISGPRHPYSQALLGAVPSAHRPRAVTGIPGRPPSTVNPWACSFASRCGHAVARCTHAHPELRSFEPGHLVRCIRAEEMSSRPAQGDGPRERTVVSSEPLLEVAGVSCEYRNRRRRQVVVDDVSFTLHPGETLGIVGESGSGKSTLLRAIVGLHAPSAGSIRLHEMELASSAVKRPRAVRRELQIVFQNAESSLNPRQTVADIVGRPIRLFRDVSRDEARGLVIELLEAVKLPAGIMGRHPAELSGGQKQRVALARGFAAQPSVLLCDEVTSSLDVSVQATMLELLADLAHRFRTAVVFVSHDLAVVRTIAARTLVMREGRICEQGETERLFLSPSHPYTQELLASIPDVAEAVA
jgi:peptide/nickel transport system ATP-binding protein